MSRYVILGASSGIGAALTASLAAEGHTLFVGARRSGLLREQTGQWPTVERHYCDVTSEGSVSRFWSMVQVAGGAVDGLVVTVGSQGEINRVADSDPGDWWATVRTNLYGPYLATSYGLPHLTPTARILVCAGGGSHAPWPHYSAYACAKAGLVRLVETLAQEIPQPVNALAPGWCRTAIHTATLNAGPARAGAANFDRAFGGCADADGAAVANAVACACWLLQDAPAELTGRTISAQHDPWQTEPEALLWAGAGQTMRVHPYCSPLWMQAIQQSVAGLV